MILASYVPKPGLGALVQAPLPLGPNLWPLVFPSAHSQARHSHGLEKSWKESTVGSIKPLHATGVYACTWTRVCVHVHVCDIIHICPWMTVPPQQITPPPSYPHLAPSKDELKTCSLSSLVLLNLNSNLPGNYCRLKPLQPVTTYKFKFIYEHKLTRNTGDELKYWESSVFITRTYWERNGKEEQIEPCSKAEHTAS